jgi:hypothetical protein
MFPISYRDLELMLADRGVEVDQTSIFRWIQAYAPELEKRIRPHLRPSNGSWRVSWLVPESESLTDYPVGDLALAKDRQAGAEPVEVADAVIAIPWAKISRLGFNARACSTTCLASKASGMVTKSRHEVARLARPSTSGSAALPTTASAPSPRSSLTVRMTANQFIAPSSSTSPTRPP